jgi:hypothetical protein
MTPHKRTAFARWGRTLLAGAILAAGMLAVLQRPSPALASAPATPAGWSNVFTDDFNGASGSGINTGNWFYDTGTSYPGGAANWGTGEIESYTNSTSNVYQDGAGHLVIKAIRGANGAWTSGRIESQSSGFQPPAGGVMHVEASIQLPNVTGAAAQGYWPAFWMLGAPFRGNYNNWPTYGEMDTMENVNGVNTVYGTLHCGVNPGGPCNETSGLGGNRSGFSPSLQTAFHTYAVEYDKSVSPEQIRWYVDGVNYWTVNSSQMDATTWANTTNHGWFLLLNVAIGGGWPGNPTSATASGAAMLVDYVTVRTKGASGGGPVTSGSIYKLINTNSGKALDVYAAGIANGTNVQIYTDNGTGAQKWQPISNSDGSYRFINTNSGKALDVTSSGTADGTNVQIWTDNGTGAQRWKITANSDGSYTLINVNSGKALDVSGAGTADGTNVQIWTSNGTGAQKWKFVQQ